MHALVKTLNKTEGLKIPTENSPANALAEISYFLIYNYRTFSYVNK